MIIRRMQRTLRGRNALLNIFELWVGLAGVVSGLIFFYSPASVDENALAQVIGHNLSACWELCYMIAGALVWYGLLRPSPKWEVVALFLLGGATAINGLAIVDIFGLRGAATAVTLISLTAASWVRAIFVLRTAIRLVGEAESVGR